MEGEFKVEKFHRNRVHSILAHSYTLYFIFFLIGVVLDASLNFKVFTSSLMIPFGVTLLVFGSILSIWAQFVSRSLDIKNLNKESFSKGPYSFSRHPTHWGLFFLTLGFGIMINATFIILATVVSFLISKFIFVKKQEEVLAAKYGQPYLEYKKSVRI